jgi:hypothetical protein
MSESFVVQRMMECMLVVRVRDMKRTFSQLRVVVNRLNRLQRWALLTCKRLVDSSLSWRILQVVVVVGGDDDVVEDAMGWIVLIRQ